MKKKTKRKLNKKKLGMFFFLVIMIVVATVFILKNKEDKPKLTKAMSALDTFISYINEQKYEEMYNMLSVSAKKNTTKEEFIAKNEEIYGQIEARLVTVLNMSEEEENRKNKSDLYKSDGDDCRNINF